MIKTLRIFSLILLIITIVSCKKWGITGGTPDQPIQHIAYDYEGIYEPYSGYYDFEYDENNRIVKTTYTKDTFYIMEESYEYDKKGRLIHVECNKGNVLYCRSDIQYDGKKMITYMDFFFDDFLKYKIITILDDDSYPSEITTYDVIYGRPKNPIEHELEYVRGNLNYMEDTAVYVVDEEKQGFLNRNIFQYDGIGHHGLFKGQHPTFHIFKMFSIVRVGEIHDCHSWERLDAFSLDYNTTRRYYRHTNDTVFFTNDYIYEYNYTYNPKGYPTKTTLKFENKIWSDSNWVKRMVISY